MDLNKHDAADNLITNGDTVDGVRLTNLYRELSISTTSIGLLRAEISVNPTMSLK